jgi:hypothetical protein
MSAPSEKAKTHKRERTNSQDSVYMQPDVALLNQKQNFRLRNLPAGA